jgi:hypothetical protein
MRFVILSLAALALSACGVVTVSTDHGGTQKVDLSAPADGETWRMSVVADKDAKIILVRRPDGLMAAAKVAGQTSAIMEAGEAQAMFSEQSAALAVRDGKAGDRVVIKVPGFSLNVQDESGGTERGNVSIQAGGRSINVQGGDSGAGERAVVTISGATAEDAADFIAEAEGLDAPTKAALKQTLGL